jgi:hypothetical protein
MGTKKLLLFCGSPRKKGTSYSFARTIGKLAVDRGCQTEIHFICDYFSGVKNPAELKTLVAGCGIIGLAAPLYVDTWPAPVIWWMEKLAAEMKPELRDKRFFALAQNGFPDITLFQPMMETSRLFAEAVGLKYLGGLGYGGGAIIDGTLLENLGKKGEKITSGFRMAVDDILADRTISPQVQKILTIQFPKSLYWPITLMLNRRARQAAKKNGVKDLKRKPYMD